MRRFLVVNKPAGVVVYSTKGSGDGLMTIRAAITFAVTPSKSGTYCTLRRPQPVHRLDKPTSGALIIAKTKPAMVNLSHQFRDRKIKKTYTAIVNGIPPEPLESKISSKEAHLLGVDVDPDTRSEDRWQVIDNELDEKNAVTVWMATKYSNSIDANDNVLTTVELKPKTGRFHQLRRHLSWVCRCPIVGDNEYDGGGPAMNLREEGLFLCSNKVTVEHPFYNGLKEDGKAILHRLPEKDQEGLWLSPEGKVMVTATIEIPDKFNSFVSKENARFAKLLSSAEESNILTK
jgi:23S rRNA-/tRNA-specific pseudouridylate synthase